MAESIRVRAAAKINLHLRVYRRRADGFHGLSSLFQAVSLGDTITIRSLKESDTIEIDGEFDCPIRSTTIYKAVIGFREATDLRSGLAIEVEKRIPAGAGLGGGSSDAAAILSGLDALFGASLPRERLAEMGAAVGSDVPFFIMAAAAFVSGRGERVRPIAPRDDFSLVIADPGFPSATARAYALLDSERPDDSAEADPSPEDLVAAYGGPIRDWPFANSFEPIVGGTQAPRIPGAKRILLEAGASFASMSGSGSSVFGAFEDEDCAERARNELERAGFSVYDVKPLARWPTLD